MINNVAIYWLWLVYCEFIGVRLSMTKLRARATYGLRALILTLINQDPKPFVCRFEDVHRKWIAGSNRKHRAPTTTKSLLIYMSSFPFAVPYTSTFRLPWGLCQFPPYTRAHLSLTQFSLSFWMLSSVECSVLFMLS